ncbi:MAG TPA: hypothetical protein VNA89_15280 [Gemmatimonadaceae bacterium]|nr:hypothetical protein [Gemmatimonadaceae bacterium]
MAPPRPEILALGSPSSALGFTRTGGGHWAEWDRFLTLDGAPAYHLGNICNTCQLLFQRLDGANRTLSADRLGAELGAGRPSLDPSWLRAVGDLLPPGDYLPFYAELPPALVRPGGPGDYFAEEQIATWGVDAFWALPHDPRTEYYRGRRVELPRGRGWNRAIFEFVVPMVPHTWLDVERVTEYRVRAAGEPPTALALSVLDVKMPATWDQEPAVAEHWCLVHYLLDGHHKTYAAALAGAPVGVLSYLAVGESLAERGDVLEAVARLATRVAP